MSLNDGLAFINRRTHTMKHRFTKTWYVVALLALLIASPGHLRAQSPPSRSLTPKVEPGPALDAGAKTEVIEAALKALKDSYVFPETADRMEQTIRERAARKEFDAVTDAAEFAGLLTTRLQEISHDKHLRVLLSNDSRMGADPETRRAMAVKRNFGFEGVERLRGNIGYLDLRGFEPADLARGTSIAAMRFLNHTDALIIDLRQNGGGSPEMVALLSSYFFDKRTHLNDIYERPGNRTREFWTEQLSPEKSYGSRPVFVLTSNRTFSAAEEFSYNLQSLKRATIVGETTGGGAHPVQIRPLGQRFLISVPFARSINPITKTNWEGVGVKPDVPVEAEKALKAAHLIALQNVLPLMTERALADDLKKLIDELKNELGSLSIPEAIKTAPATASQAAATVSTAEFKLPETPAGRTVGKFLAALNSGDAEKLKRFHRETGGDEGNAAQDLDMFQKTGGVDARRVVESGDFSITVLTQTKKDGKWLKFSFGVDAQPPHALNEVRIQNASAADNQGERQGPGQDNARSTNATPANGKLSEGEFLKSVNSLIDAEAARDRFSGVVIIAKNGKPLLERAVGLASKSYNVANMVDTRFNLGSINKLFTQVAILQLAEAGKLSLDDKLGKYLPAYPNREAAEKVTINQLIRMQSGIGDFFGAKFQATPKNKIRTLDDYMTLFAAEPLKFEPGTSQAYSNGGYIVLGAIIEKVSGQSYYDYFYDHIFKPAGMDGAQYLNEDEVASNVAAGYTRRGDVDGKLVSNVYTKPARGSSAGGGYATAGDLLKFSTALEKNLLLNAAQSKALTSRGFAGGAPGINAILEMNVAGGYTIIVLSNYDPPSAEQLSSEIRTLL
jgi:CubicO group peptidase (beta-lactamase class C family)